MILFRAAAEAFGPRPAAELARRLFATGQVDAVHVFSNVVTVGLKQGGSASGLSDVIGSLYQYWHPGMQPPTFDEPAPEESAGDGAGDGGGGGAGGDAGGDAALSEAAKRVPVHLLERSRAARERWKAKNA